MIDFAADGWFLMLSFHGGMASIYRGMYNKGGDKAHEDSFFPHGRRHSAHLDSGAPALSVSGWRRSDKATR